MMTKSISKWTLAILAGAVMWMAGSALGVGDGEANASVLASHTLTASTDDPGNTWPTPSQVASDDPGNTWPTPTRISSDDPGNTWPGVNQVNGNTWP